MNKNTIFLIFLAIFMVSIPMELLSQEPATTEESTKTIPKTLEESITIGNSNNSSENRPILNNNNYIPWPLPTLPYQQLPIAPYQQADQKSSKDTSENTQSSNVSTEKTKSEEINPTNAQSFITIEIPTCKKKQKLIGTPGFEIGCASVSNENIVTKEGLWKEWYPADYKEPDERSYEYNRRIQKEKSKIPGTKIKSVGFYQSGERSGEWIYYYPNGQKKGEGKYQLGRRIGFWIWYNPNGTTAWTGSFEKGITNGEWTIFDIDGIKESHGFYCISIPCKKWTFYYNNNDMKSTGSLKNSKAHGKWTFFHNNGNKKAEGEMFEGMPIKQWSFWYKNGTLRARGTFGDTQRGQYWGYNDCRGEWAIFYSNGQKRREFSCLGESSSKCTSWYRSGQKQSEINEKITLCWTETGAPARCQYDVSLCNNKTPKIPKISLPNPRN